MPPIPVYLATVCLERNRWGSKQPSFPVSEWLPRIAQDGFDGVELWENHYLAADPAEQQRLVERAAPLAVYNSYVGFGDGASDAQQREACVAAVQRLGAGAVKFNLGAKLPRLDEYRRNFRAWADRLPARCRLLCECHNGSVLEKPEAAAEFFADLDPARFGVIVHVAGDAAGLQRWFDRLGARITHLHLQHRTPQTDPTAPEGSASLAACVAVLRSHRFAGSATVEFTRGVGPLEDIHTLYRNACADRQALLQSWLSP